MTSDDTGRDSARMRIRWQMVALVLAGAAAASSFSTLLAYQAVRNAGQQPVIWRLAT